MLGLYIFLIIFFFSVLFHGILNKTIALSVLPLSYWLAQRIYFIIKSCWYVASPSILSCQVIECLFHMLSVVVDSDGGAESIISKQCLGKKETKQVTLFCTPPSPHATLYSILFHFLLFYSAFFIRARVLIYSGSNCCLGSVTRVKLYLLPTFLCKLKQSLK